MGERGIERARERERERERETETARGSEWDNKREKGKYKEMC